MRSGYGRVLLSKARGFELPLILGKDIAGEVVKVGAGVSDLSVGDAVYGVPSSKAQGAYAEYVISTCDQVVLKPKSLSFEQAAAIPYVACTVWDALVTKAGLGPESSKGKKVFVQGGGGGIGSLAIQLLKNWGAYVATTCRQSDMADIKALGADSVFDYRNGNYSTSLSNFDVVLETIGGSYEEKSLNILRKDGRGTFVTLIHPLLATFDEIGLMRGAIQNFLTYRENRAKARKKGIGNYYWSTFKPSLEALTVVRDLADANKFAPRIDRAFSLNDIVKAHEYCEQGKSRGKVIVRI